MATNSKNFHEASWPSRAENGLYYNPLSDNFITGIVVVFWDILKCRQHILKKTYYNKQRPKGNQLENTGIYNKYDTNLYISIFKKYILKL